MLGHAGPILAVCWAYVRPMFGQGGTYVQQLAKFWVMFKNVEKHRVLEQKRGHLFLLEPKYWDMLGSVWHMLGYVGPILGLCRAYVKPIEPILRPILSQDNHV